MRTLRCSWSLPFIVSGLVFIIATLLSVVVTAQAPDPFPRVAPETVGMSSEKLREASATVQKWAAEERIIGAVLLVIRDGKTVLHEATGWSDRERRLPMRRDHIVSMRSMTKPLVGTAALMLREAGKLNFEDRVAQYLPSFDNSKSRDITVFQLLTHTSGIRGEIYVGTGGTQFKTLREAVDAIGAKGPDTPPGAEYFYSDPGTSTLGALVAERAGMPVEDFIRSRILDPLGMKDSFLVDEPASPLRQRVASVYRQQSGGPWTRYWDNTMPPIVPFFRASGGLYSTVLDYASFMAAIMGHGRMRDVQLLTPQSVEFALQPHSSSVFPGDRRATMDQFYGFDWFVLTDKFRAVEPPFSDGVFFHGGSDGTLAWADPKHKLIIVYATQSRFSDTPREFVRQVYAALIN